MSSDEKLDELLRRTGLLETGIRNLGTRVEAIETRLQAFESQSQTNADATKERLADIQSDVRKLHRKFDLLNEDVSEVRSDQRDVNRRLDKLEEKAS